MAFIAKDQVLPIEVYSHTTAGIDEVSLNLRTSAVVGNRTVKIVVRPSTSLCCSILNDLKLRQTMLASLLNSDTSVSDEDYAGTNAPNATDLASALTLMNDFKAKHNIIVEKLDLDNLVDDDNYEATMGSGSQDATDISSLGFLIHEMYQRHERLVKKIEADVDFEYQTLCLPANPFQFFENTIESGATQQASESILHLFVNGVADSVVSNTVHFMDLGGTLYVPAGYSLFFEMSTVVDASGDKVDVLIN